MKKGLLLAGAVFSLGALASSANAVTIRIDEEQMLKFGARGIIDATIAGKRTTNDKSDIQFTHRNARIYFKYRLNRIVSLGFQTEFFAKASDKDFEILDSYINLSFAPELNVIAGSYKVPFERHSGLQSGWSVLFPTGPGYTGNVLTTVTQKLLNSNYKHIKHVFSNPIADIQSNVGYKVFRSGSRSAGLTVWGNIADGMFKYYVGVYDVNDEIGINQDDYADPKTGFALRLQFTPTMLGYKPEKGYVLKNTYVGKKDVLTIGISYANQDYRGTGSDAQTSWGVDLMWEQKFGTLVPNFQIGYVKHNNWRGAKPDDRTGWLVQGQLLYDQKVFLGKPALVVRYVRSDFDKNALSSTLTGDPSLTTWGIGVNYYIKGYANRVSLAVDTVDPDKDLQTLAGTKGSWTDVTLSIFYNF